MGIRGLGRGWGLLRDWLKLPLATSCPHSPPGPFPHSWVPQPEAPKAMGPCGAKIVVWEWAGYMCFWGIDGTGAMSQGRAMLWGGVKAHCWGNHWTWDT